MLVKNFNNVAAEDQILDFARDVAFDNFDSPDAEGELNIFVIEDNTIDPGGCPFGDYNHDGVNVEQFPNTDGDVNNFVSLILGKFQVDDGDDVEGEDIPLTFHVDSDDRSYFSHRGAKF